MLQIDYYSKTFLPLISNTKWEGDIQKMGDKVHIRWRPAVEIFAYTDEMELPLQMLETQVTELPIDKGFAYNIAQSIVSLFQSDIDMLQEASADQAEKMSIEVDQEVLSYIYTQAHAQLAGATAGKNSNINFGSTGAPLVLTPSNVLTTFSRMKQALNELQVPKDNRFIVGDEELAHILRQSDLKDSGFSGDDPSLIRSDVVAKVHGFTVLESDNLTYSSDGGNTVANACFGHPDGMTFASQFVKTEVKPREKQFGERTAGLKVYGRKGVQKKAIGHLYYQVA